MSVATVAAELVAALKTVPGLRVSLVDGVDVDPPAAIVGPPSMTWEALCDGATTATFRVGIVVAADDRALERLWDLVVLVAEALDDIPDVSVTRADPGSFLSSSAELPAYDITVECSL